MRDDSTHYLLIGRGLAGWHASGVWSDGECSVSGAYGETPPQDWVDRAEDAWVYDVEGPCRADKQLERAFAKFVICGPIPSPRTEKWSDENTHAAGNMAAGLDNVSAGLIAQAVSGGQALDRVSYAEYIGLLRQAVPTARIGRVLCGTIVWEVEP